MGSMKLCSSVGEDETALFYVSGSKTSQRQKMGLEKMSRYLSIDGDQHMKQKGNIDSIKGKNRVNDLCKSSRCLEAYKQL